MVFVEKLREVRKRGTFDYGALAGRVGQEFEDKWLPAAAVDSEALTATDFSATTDLYSIVRNTREMRDIPFAVRDLRGPIEAAALPFVPVAFVVFPMRDIVTEVIRLLT